MLEWGKVNPVYSCLNCLEKTEVMGPETDNEFGFDGVVRGSTT